MKSFKSVMFGLLILAISAMDDFWNILEEDSATTVRTTAADDQFSDDIFWSDGIMSDYQSCLNRIRTEADISIDTNEIPGDDDVLSNRDSGVFRSGIERMKLWKSARLPLLVDKMSKRKKRLLACAVVFFHENTCIRFTQKRATDDDYVFITENDQRRGCFSTSLGNAGGRHVVNLDKRISHCWKHGTIVHELMHALGFYHEQARNDRDKFIDINWNIIPKRWKRQFETAREQGLDQTMVGKYDYESVMHYSRFSFHPVTPVLSAKVAPTAANNARMGNRDAPTQMDKFKLNALYCGVEEKNSNKEICDSGFVSVQTDFTFTEYYQTPDVDDAHPWSSRRCDWTQGHGRDNYWMKLEGSGGTKILDRKPRSASVCGASFPGYIIGNHPQKLYEIVHRKMCYYTGQGCSRETPEKSVEILKCGNNQYLYKIKATPHCYLAFCTVPEQPPTKKHICENGYRTVRTDPTFTVDYQTPEIDNAHPWSSRRCDWSDGNADGRWMKLEGNGGNEIIDRRPDSTEVCGASYPGYIMGEHPLELYQSVYRKLCYYNGHGCDPGTNDESIEILNCGNDQFLYRIKGTPGCYLAFCTASKRPPSNKHICDGGYRTVQTDRTFSINYPTPPVDKVHPWSSRRCDWSDGNADGRWMKLEGNGGNKIIDRRPDSTEVCGASYPGYIMGDHPLKLYQSVYRKLCYYNGHGCDPGTDDKSVEILNCGNDQFLYRIKGTPGCYLAFCTASKRPPSKKRICDGGYRTVLTDQTFTVNYRTPPVDKTHPWSSRRCDWSDGNANGRWMKLEGKGGSRILDQRPRSDELCGASYPGYIIGFHPTEIYQSVYRKLCYYNGQNCSSKTGDKSIEILNCGYNQEQRHHKRPQRHQFLYRIIGVLLTDCYLAFCTVP